MARLSPSPALHMLQFSSIFIFLDSCATLVIHIQLRFFKLLLWFFYKLEIEGVFTLGQLVERWRKCNNLIGGELRGRPMGLRTSVHTLKVKGLQSVYMAVFFGTFDAKSLASRQKFGSSEKGNPNSSQEVKLFFNKILIIWEKDTHNK